MTTLHFDDLALSQCLDVKSMAALIGGADIWNLRSISIVTGGWSAYMRDFKQILPQTVHDGYKADHSFEGFRRTRTQTEYTTWDHFFRV